MSEPTATVINPGSEMGQDSEHSAALVPLQTSAAISAARAEVESALLIAKRFPRNERDAAAKLKRACQRLGMAESATWKFKRGAEVIDGPAVYLARQAKICWGNMDAGFRALERTEDETLVEGYAIDRETNSTTRYQQRVKNLIQRPEWVTDAEGNRTKVDRWVRPNERDYSELIARVGAKLERNAIFAIIPQDVIDDAVRQAKATLLDHSQGKLTKSRDEVVVELLASFDGLGVSRADIERRLEHKLETINAQEYADLMQIGKSIADGQSTVAEFFGSTSGPAAPGAANADAKAEGLKRRLETQRGAKPAPASEPAQDPASAAASDVGDAAPAADTPRTTDPARTVPSTARRQHFAKTAAAWLKATDSKDEDGRLLVAESCGYRTRNSDELNADELEVVIARMESEIERAKGAQ